ncbi:MAG: flagellar export protein FliJ [Propionivibrio sp.]
MAKPFSLQTVLELMQARSDDATQNLARLIARERDEKTKFDLLEQYRHEYAQRFQEAACKGLSPHAWHNYQEFLSRLDAAIDVQRQVVAQQQQATVSGQQQWQEQRKKLKAIDTLSARHFSNEHTLENKRIQKTQDEFAARGRKPDDT